MRLNARDVSVTLANRELVKQVSLEVRDKRFVGLLGPNGSGKTTLLKSIYRVLKPSAGLVTLDDANIQKLSYRDTARRMGVISQFNEMNFDFTAEEIVLMGRAPHKSAFSRDTEEDYRIAEDALRRVDMLDFRDRNFNTLSGGEKQRILLARTLAQQVELLILDLIFFSACFSLIVPGLKVLDTFRISNIYLPSPFLISASARRPALLKEFLLLARRFGTARNTATMIAVNIFIRLESIFSQSTSV